MKSFKNRKDPDTDTSFLSKDLGKHAGKALASVAVSNILTNIMGLGGTIILARLLGPEDFGLMAMLATAIALLTVFENFGLYFATIQKKTLSNEELNFLFWANLVVASLMAAVMFFSAGFIANFFHEPQLKELSQVLALAFICRGAANQHAALLNRKLQHGKSSMATVVAVFLATGGSIVMAMTGFGVWSLIWRQVIEAFVRTVMLWLYTGWIPRFVSWQKDFMHSLGFGASMTVSNLMYYLSRNADDILIGKYIGAEQLGYYKLSYQILLLPLRRINEPVGQVMIPLLSQLQDQPERYRKNYMRAVHLLAMLQWPLGVLFLIHGVTIIEIVFGAEWLPAVVPLQWLAASLFIQALSNTTGWLFISQGRSKEILYWAIFTSVTTIISFLIGLPYGIGGVAMWYVLVSYMRMPFLFYICGRKGPVRTRDLYGAMFAHLPAMALYALINYGAGLYLPELTMPLQFIALAALGLAVFPVMMIFPSTRNMVNDGLGYVRNKLQERKLRKAAA